MRLRTRPPLLTYLLWWWRKLRAASWLAALSPPFCRARGWTRLALAGMMGVVPVTMSHRRVARRRLTGRVSHWYASTGTPSMPGITLFFRRSRACWISGMLRVASSSFVGQMS